MHRDGVFTQAKGGERLAASRCPWAGRARSEGASGRESEKRSSLMRMRNSICGPRLPFRAADKLLLEQWIPVIETLCGRPRFRRTLSLDRARLSGEGLAPTPAERVVALPLLYLLVPYYANALQAKGWLVGRRQRHLSVSPPSRTTLRTRMRGATCSEMPTEAQPVRQRCPRT